MRPGDLIPPFQLPDQSGRARAFADLSGPRGLVLYAYPKDHSSGCATETSEFQEELAQFTARGYGLAGLSKDGVASHAKFAAKLGLGFPLLADPQTGLLKALGAWGVKKMYGKETEGTVRSTYVFDAGGLLVRAYAKVKAQGHAARVLADLGS